MTHPPRWTPPQLDQDRESSIADFRRQRLEEPLEAYLALFEQYQDSFENLLELTVDLTQLPQHGLKVLTEDHLIEAVRYLTGPPISMDDLETVAEAKSLTRRTLLSDPSLVTRIIELVLTALDRRRFPWVSEGRDPSEKEKCAAIIASTSLLATSKLGTERRNKGKKAQEQRVEDILLACGFQKRHRRKIQVLTQAPDLGEFCGESMFGTRRADFVIRLWDQRVMPLECKVSNSFVNSVKRLNNDAAVKAEVWRSDFGSSQIVPTAVLSGLFKRANLEEAQNRGLTIFWGHKLEALVEWIETTRPR